MVSSVSNSPTGLLGLWHSRITQLAAFVVLLGLGTPLYAATLYVDGALSADCSSTNYSLVSRDCRGGDGPGYATFASAIAAMRPGDTVAIRGGTYRTPLIVNKSGTASAHLEFQAYPGETPIIDLAGVGADLPLYLRPMGIAMDHQSYSDFSGLTVYNAPGYGFSGRSATDITITDCEFAYSSNSGIAFEIGANITVTRSRIHHSHRSGGRAHEAVTFRNVNQFSITDSEVYENGKEGIDAKYGSTHGVIARNHVYRNKSANIYLDASNHIQVFENFSHDTWVSTTGLVRQACIGLGIESTPNPERYQTTDVAVYNNVMYGCGAGITFWAETGGLSWARFERIRIEYNTIVENDHAGIWIIFSHGTAGNFGSGITIRNNIIMDQGFLAIRDAEGASVTQLFTIDHNLFKSGQRSATFGSNAVMTATSPFVNSSGRDFHLVAGSQARNAGQSVQGISTDIEGRLRPDGMTDAGAYQFASGGNEAGPPAPTLPPKAPTNVRVVR